MLDLTTLGGDLASGYCVLGRLLPSLEAGISDPGVPESGQQNFKLPLVGSFYKIL